MYLEIKNMSLCRTIFKRCELGYNWVYRYQGRPGNDNQDFNQSKVIGELKHALELPHMSENSVLVLNLGLHYLQTISFSKYVKLLQKIVEMLKSPRSDGRKNARMIWKTTTWMTKEMSVTRFRPWRRFLTNPVSL
jgi:hypothetical protein